MQKVTDVMTSNVQVIAPTSTIREAAMMMRDLDVGVIPVCESDEIRGIVTDRDITIRATAMGLGPDALVSDVMTKQVVTVSVEQELSELADLMEEKQIRRVLVIDGDKRLCGIVSLGDLALDTDDDGMVGEVLERVSEPSSVPTV